jgi:hypothetical protein
MYFAARVTLREPDDYKRFLSTIIPVAVLIGVLGIYEMSASWSPWQALMAFKKFTWIDKGPQYRFDLLRASGATSVYIYFGLAGALLFGFFVILWRIALKRRTAGLLIGMLGSIAATASSLSSGPWVMVFVFGFLIIFYRFKQLIRPGILAFIVFLILIEIASNRHFYNVIDYVSLDPATAWYRAKLFEVFLSNFNEWWLVGTGSDSLLHWAAQLDGRNHLDIVNHYVWIGISGGLPAITLMVVFQINCFKNAMAIYRLKEPSLEFPAFAYCCFMLAIMFAMNTVSFFGPGLLFVEIFYGALPHMRKSVKDGSGDAGLLIMRVR